MHQRKLSRQNEAIKTRQIRNVLVQMNGDFDDNHPAFCINDVLCRRILKILKSGKSKKKNTIKVSTNKNNA